MALTKKAFIGKLKKIRLLISDVDGVLTRGEIIYDDQGQESKVFNVKDGLGLSLLARTGLKVVLLSARSSPMLRKRAKDMRVSEVIGGVLPKEKVLGPLLKKYGLKVSQVCFIGDDLIDINIMKRVGLSIAVNDAAPEVKKIASYITANKGGEGAVREVVDLTIRAQGLNKKIQQILAALSK